MLTEKKFLCAGLWGRPENCHAYCLAPRARAQKEVTPRPNTMVTSMFFTRITLHGQFTLAVPVSVMLTTKKGGTWVNMENSSSDARHVMSCLSSQKRGSGGASLTNHPTRYILLFSKSTFFPPPRILASSTTLGPNMPELCQFLNLSVSGPPGICQSHLQNKANSPDLLPRSKTLPSLTWTIPTAPLLLSKLHHFGPPPPAPTTFSVLFCF